MCCLAIISLKQTVLCIYFKQLSQNDCFIFINLNTEYLGCEDCDKSVIFSHQCDPRQDFFFYQIRSETAISTYKLTRRLNSEVNV